PIYGEAPGRPESTVHATFRLDSLGTRKGMAFISMRGSITREIAAERGKSNAVETIGSITGGMVVDAYRGWITDSRTAITVKSKLSPVSAQSAPMHFQLRMTQRMRATDRR